jgi:hypothetical protein
VTPASLEAIEGESAMSEFDRWFIHVPMVLVIVMQAVAFLY